MKIIQFILAVLGLIFVALIAYFLFGYVVSLIWYAILLFAVLAIGYFIYKAFNKPKKMRTIEVEEVPKHKQIEAKVEREMMTAQEVIEKYKRELTKD
ncbi:MAG: hypothetical protein H7Z37_13880 [Pyrinomonadaceae bacterium]|nr:hypothetical protein [Pyrinomonadaceae bacterium]